MTATAPTYTSTVGTQRVDAQLTLPFGRFRMDELRQEHPGKWAHILHPDHDLTLAFLAEETLRIGGRGREVVGRVLDGREELPLTGCEGYFVATCRGHYDPERPGRRMGELRTPAEIVLLIAHIGCLLLERVEDDLDTRYLSRRDTTPGEIMRWTAAHEMDENLLRCLNGVYGGLLGMLRANDNPQLRAFRDQTYCLVAGMPAIDLIASDTALTLHYQVPAAAPARAFTTQVQLDQHNRRGYEFMAQISPYLGNPVTRTYLRSEE